MKKTTLLLPSILIAALLAGCAASFQDVNAKDYSGSTPLHNAAMQGDIWAARTLIDRGADMNAKDSLGYTPLHWAISADKKDLVELLISKGADAAIRNNKGVLPSKFAENAGHADIARLLKEAEKPGLRRAEAAEEGEKAEFEKTARVYREAAVKPAIPEDARKFRVQADALIRDKEFERAAELYGKALSVAPWWPDARFNRALVLGESGSYLEAMREMKKYLTLVPNAPDARAAQDKIYEWEIKAGGK